MKNNLLLALLALTGSQALVAMEPGAVSALQTSTNEFAIQTALADKEAAAAKMSGLAVRRGGRFQGPAHVFTEAEQALLKRRTDLQAQVQALFAQIRQQEQNAGADIQKQIAEAQGRLQALRTALQAAQRTARAGTQELYAHAREAAVPLNAEITKINEQLRAAGLNAWDIMRGDRGLGFNQVPGRVNEPVAVSAPVSSLAPTAVAIGLTAPPVEAGLVDVTTQVDM